MENREIKFRAWHFGQKKMFSAEEMTADQMALLPDGHFANINSVSTKLSEVYSHEEMLPLQYTGLHDRNGKEIYEGDIVKGDNFQRFSGNPVVRWDGNGSFVLETDTGNSIYRETFFSFLQGEGHELRHLEVVGNIYQNPELLTN